MKPAILARCSRLGRLVRQEGLFPLVTRRVSAACNRWWRPRLYVWVWRPGDPLSPPHPTLNVERFSAPHELSPTLLAELIENDGPDFTARMQEEFDEGGILWVGLWDGRPAGYQWSRRGTCVTGWHFELTERDVLVYSTVTFPEFRGKGVGPGIVSELCRREMEEGGRICADCMIWNTPAVRFLQKAGFTAVAIRPPLVGHPD